MSSLESQKLSHLNAPLLDLNWTCPEWAGCSGKETVTLDPSLAFLGSFVLLFLAMGWVSAVTFRGLGSSLKDFPGPPAWPVVGSFLSVYNKRPETLYKAWAERYGSVFRVQIGSTPALIVNSGEAAKDIFTSNSQDLASRPQLYTFHKVTCPQHGTVESHILTHLQRSSPAS